MTGHNFVNFVFPGTNAGSNTYCPDTDQRDWQRWDPSCDIGAYEVGAFGPLIFADGFEDGTTGEWSATTP